MPESEVAFGHFGDVRDCPPGLVERLRHDLVSYKQKLGESSHRVSIAEVYDRAEALEVIRRSEKDHQERFGSPAARAELKRLLGGE